MNPLVSRDLYLNGKHKKQSTNMPKTLYFLNQDISNGTDGVINKRLLILLRYLHPLFYVSI